MTTASANAIDGKMAMLRDTPHHIGPQQALTIVRIFVPTLPDVMNKRAQPDPQFIAPEYTTRHRERFSRWPGKRARWSS